MITESQEKVFQDKVVNDFKEALYNLDIEQSFDFKRLHDLQNDKERLRKITAYNEQITGLTNKRKPQDEIERVKFFKSKLTMPEQRLYEVISQRAEKIQSVLEMVEFVRNFKASKIPGLAEKLPYAVINDTRYSMVDNVIQKDSNGGMILHLEPAKLGKKVKEKVKGKDVKNNPA